MDSAGSCMTAMHNAHGVVRLTLLVGLHLMSGGMPWANSIGPASDTLQGDYTGIFSCGLETFRFSLNLRAEADGRVSGTLGADPLHRMSGQGVRTQQATVRGTYTPTSGGFALVGDRVVWRKLVDLQGVFLRDGSAWLGVPKSPYSTQCSSWVAVKGSGVPQSWGRVLAEAEAGSRLTPGRNTFESLRWAKATHKAQKKFTCDDEILRWVAQVPDELHGDQGSDPRLPVRQLFRSERFEPFFGAPFEALSVARRRALFLEMSGACARDTQVARQSAMYIGLASSAIVNQPNLSATDVMISVLATEAFAVWQRDVLQYFSDLPVDAADVSLVDAVAADARPMLAGLWTPEAREFEQALAQHRARIMEPSLQRKLRLAVAKARASGAVSDLLSVARFADRYRSDIWTLPVEARERFGEHHKGTLSQLTGATFGPGFKAIGKSPPGMRRLAQSAAWYREQDFVFSSLPALPSVDAILLELAARRRESAAAAAAEFGAMVAGLKTAADLAAVEQKYFIEPDRSDAQFAPLLDELEKRRNALEATDIVEEG